MVSSGCRLDGSKDEGRGLERQEGMGHEFENLQNHMDITGWLTTVGLGSLVSEGGKKEWG